MLALTVTACGSVTETPPDAPPPDGSPVEDEGTEITMTVYSAAALAQDGGTTFVALVAYQDGAGPWQAMTGAAGVYRARVKDPRYGVAVACVPRQLEGGVREGDVSVWHSTTAEQVDLKDLSCVSAGTPRTITGAAIGDLGLGTFEIQSAGNVRHDATNREFAIPAPTGRFPVFGVAFQRSTTVPAKVVRAPDVDTAVGGAVSVDFDQAVPPKPYPLTVVGGAATPTVSTSVRNGDLFFARMDGSPTEYLSVPPTLLRGGDLVRLYVVTVDSLLLWRSSLLYLGTPGPATIDFATPFAVAAPTLTQGTQLLPTFSLPTGGTTQPFVDYSFRVSTSDDEAYTRLVASFSSGWLGTAGPVTYSYPDLSGVAGWDEGMALGAGRPVDWSATRVEMSTREFVAGRKVYSSMSNGTVNP